MFKKSIVFLVFAILFLTPYQVKGVFAVSVPNFPSCGNPQGSLKVQFDEGIHGIVDDETTHAGSDAVYITGDNSLVQCFCPVSGEGIQTNWWKVSSLLDEEIEALKVSGWILIPNGVLWGLDEDPYLAINSNYSCLATGGGGSQGSTGEVLGLASTGNILTVYLFLIVGILALLTGLILKKFSK